MLVAARDKDGKPIVFATDFPNAPSLVDGKWYAMGCDIAVLPPEAEQFCQGIPPGEKRAIESVSVTYKPEPKSAVEELVEAAKRVSHWFKYETKITTGGVMYELDEALARVEAEKKGV